MAHNTHTETDFCSQNDLTPGANETLEKCFLHRTFVLTNIDTYEIGTDPTKTQTGHAHVWRLCYGVVLY